MEGIDFSKKKIVIADLDGTLALSKSKIDKQMSDLILSLLEYKDFAVISGGRYSQYEKQFISGLEFKPDRFARLYLLPTNATTFYKFEDGQWEQLYSEDFNEREKIKIMQSFEIALRQADFQKPEKLYGVLIEDRGTQMTFSALGQEAPLELKEKWDPDQKKRLHIKKFLDVLLPEFEVRVGGSTSIDVTKKGIDKAYGVKKIEEYFGYTKDQMIFIGDALFEGGNDYAVKKAGVDSLQVSGPEDTKKILMQIIDSSKN